MVASFLTKALVPSILLSAQYALAQGSCSKVDDVKLTFFGLGSAGVYTRFGCTGTSVTAGSATADAENAPHPSGGDGSYANPGLFATAEGNPHFQKCEIVYIPYFKKYFQYGDICEQCQTDYGSGLTHIDLWIGPNPHSDWTDATIPQSAKTETGTCEIAWGGLEGKSILQDPPKNLEVQTEALDDGNTCYNNDQTRFFPDNQASCSGGGSSNTKTDTKPALKEAVKEKSAPAAPAAPATPPIVEKVAANKKTSPTTTTSPTPTPSAPAPEVKEVKSPNTSSGDNKPGDPCPKNGWFEGCVWGSGSGQLGDTCSAKTDCWSDWICVAGKCADNKKGRRVRMARSFGGHEHARRAAHVVKQ